jgi:hypothetical protein
VVCLVDQRIGIEPRIGHHAVDEVVYVWWRCHRRIITDYLLAKGETVFHILVRNDIARARITAYAKVGPAGILSYPPPHADLA